MAGGSEATNDAVPGLVLAPYGRDAELLTQALGARGLRPVVCRDLDDLLGRLECFTLPVVMLSDDALAHGGDDHLHRALNRRMQDEDDLLPVVLLMGRSALEHPLTVLPGVTVVAKPTRRRILDSVLRSAVKMREHAMELRRQRRELEERNRTLQKARNELKSRNAALANAVEAKDRFLAAMSHELRTPLHAILGYVSLLDVGAAHPVTPEQRGVLERVRRSAAHLLRLVEDVLDLSKIGSGRVDVARDSVRVEEVVETALSLVGPQAAEKRLELNDRCGAGAELIFRGDESRVRQILANLLSNSVKFTDPGGRISVRCASVGEVEEEASHLGAGPWVAIWIEDTGRGIPPRELEQLFQPFVQGDSERGTEGAGLGLSISRRLARLMGGDVTVRSRPGEGSTFTLWLPSAAEEGRARGSARGSRDLPHDLTQAGRELQGHAHLALDRIKRRLRSDTRIPQAEDLDDAVLEDHQAVFLAVLAQQLIGLGHTGEGDPELVHDGSALQRYIAGRHGAQRSRLRWTEQAFRRELEVLSEEVERVVLEHMAEGADLAGLRSVVAQLIEEAEKAALNGFRHGRP